MKKIHLYDIHSPIQSKGLIGHYLSPPELMKSQLKKEEFSGTDEYLKDYAGKWFIEVILEHNIRKPPNNSNEPSMIFDIDVYYTGHGWWTRPAKVYLILEDLE